MDWSIEVSKDFVFIYYFKLKNAVRQKKYGTFARLIIMAVAVLLALDLSRSSMFLSVSFGCY